MYAKQDLVLWVQKWTDVIQPNFPEYLTDTVNHLADILSKLKSLLKQLFLFMWYCAVW